MLVVLNHATHVILVIASSGRRKGVYEGLIFDVIRLKTVQVLDTRLNKSFQLVILLKHIWLVAILKAILQLMLVVFFFKRSKFISG